MNRRHFLKGLGAAILMPGVALEVLAKPAPSYKGAIPILYGHDPSAAIGYVKSWQLDNLGAYLEAEVIGDRVAAALGIPFSQLAADYSDVKYMPVRGKA